MRVGLITASFGRVKILEIFAEGVRRLMDESGHEVSCVSVGSEDGRAILEARGIQFIPFPNKPLTGKFNRACQELKGKVDCVMLIGTDDLIATSTFKRIIAECEKGIDMVGIDDVYFFGLDDVHAGKLVKFNHTKVLGPARTVSARVLDGCNWTPWDQDKDRGIDTCMLDTIRPLVKTKVLLSGGYCFDLKSSLNLNKMDYWVEKFGYMNDQSIFWNNIGENETRLIKQYLER